MVARVVAAEQPPWVLRITYKCIDIEHGVKTTFFADPAIQTLA